MLFILLYCPSLLIKECVKMFPPKTKADVGMVQCVFEGYDKPPGRKQGGPCKEGTSLSTQNQVINIHVTFSVFEYICTIPTFGNILLRLRSCYHPLFLCLHTVHRHTIQVRVEHTHSYITVKLGYDLADNPLLRCHCIHDHVGKHQHRHIYSHSSGKSSLVQTTPTSSE